MLPLRYIAPSRRDSASKILPTSNISGSGCPTISTCIAGHLRRRLYGSYSSKKPRRICNGLHCPVAVCTAKEQLGFCTNGTVALSSAVGVAI